MLYTNDPYHKILKEAFASYKRAKVVKRNGIAQYSTVLRVLETDWPIATDFLMNLGCFCGMVALEKVDDNEYPIFWSIMESGLKEYNDNMDAPDPVRYAIFVKACFKEAIRRMAEIELVTENGETWTPECGAFCEWIRTNNSTSIVTKERTNGHLYSIAQNLQTAVICDRTRNILEKAHAQQPGN